jgi:hypothetical protein
MQDTADDEKADALMATLPPTAWEELATKKDLTVLEHQVTATFHRELTAQTKTFVAWTGVLMAVFTAVNAIANTTIAIAVR